jgi:NADH-quinone oxidoreductase subunit F
LYRKALMSEASVHECVCRNDASRDLAAVAAIIARHGTDRAALIPILQDIQSELHYLPQEALAQVAAHTASTPADVVGVATFFAQFRLKPAGKHIIRVCHGTACHVKGAELVDDALRRELALTGAQDTDAAGEFTVERVGCLGCCTLAPVVQEAGAPGQTFAHITASDVPALLERIRHAPAPAVAAKGQARAAATHSPAQIRIGVGSCCLAGGSGDVRMEINAALAELGLADRVELKPVGCVGMCHQTPLVEILTGRPGDEAVLYTRVKAGQMRRIVRRHFARGAVSRTLAFAADAWARLVTPAPRVESAVQMARYVRDPELASFLGPQLRLATEHSGILDPLDLDEYLHHEGFAALKRATDADAIIQTITESGLRGRGGAGFPTGRKWALVRQAAQAAAPAAAADTHSDTPAYVICNGDEGDPGAFMDRMILESYPYRVLEGLAVCAHAVGATAGYLYIRAEYPLAVERVTEAIARCTQRGLLGDLKLTIKQGAGAFVCGEETALIASIEGRRGMPRLRPPYPAERGLWDKPTCINNVETLALVPWIIRHGAGEFAAIGTARSKGTKVFALTGKIRRGGLIEVPMGTSIRQIVEDIGGGIAPPLYSPASAAAPGLNSPAVCQPIPAFKAVQIGGPSGGCIPAALADTPVDYESLGKLGAIMGSGGLVVLDERDCMVDMARYFVEFTQAESCGKCTFCRVGTRRMLDVLTRFCEGKAHASDIDALEQLAVQVQRGSLCGLGQTAPNPVLTTLRYFREEYLEHTRGICRAGRCKTLIRYEVDAACIGCTKCVQACPAGAIPYTPYRIHTIDAAKCTRCDICRSACPTAAITITSGHPVQVHTQSMRLRDITTKTPRHQDDEEDQPQKAQRIQNL